MIPIVLLLVLVLVLVIDFWMGQRVDFIKSSKIDHEDDDENEDDLRILPERL